MNFIDLKQFLQCLLQDSITFFLLQICLVLIYLFAYTKEKISGGIRVTRSEEAQNFLYIAYGIISVIWLQIINSSEAYKGYKVFYSALDSILILYLCLFNSWSRNKLMGYYIKFKTKVEHL